MSRKKKTLAQQAIGLASPVLPAPVAKVAGTRWGSRLAILLLPFLFATGVLTISWNNGIPTVNFDRARAWLVGQQVGARVQEEAVRVAQDVRERQAATGLQSLGPQSAGPQSSGQQPAWGQAQPTSWQGQPAYQQQRQPAQSAAPQWGPSAVR